MIGALAVAAVGTAIVLSSVIGVTSGARAAVITSLAYPILNITLSALVAVGFALTGWRPDRSWALLGLGGAVFALTNGIFSYQLARGTYAVGGLLDLGWVFAPVIIAVACAVPARRRKLVQPGLSLLGLARPVRAGRARPAGLESLRAVALGVRVAGRTLCAVGDRSDGADVRRERLAAQRANR